MKGQMVHNDQVQQVEVEEIASDEFWSFVQKNKKAMQRGLGEAARSWGSPP
ncbi:MAG: hypothetical protein F6K57_37490 [Moorea sp. SIO4A5]|nr:hypothetical protein [Moorena sp. SIO4A5]